MSLLFSWQPLSDLPTPRRWRWRSVTFFDRRGCPSLKEGILPRLNSPHQFKLTGRCATGEVRFHWLHFEVKVSASSHHLGLTGEAGPRGPNKHALCVQRQC
jgi:hypothetical protein